MKPATYELANAFPRIFNVHIVNVMDRLSGYWFSRFDVSPLWERDTAVNRIRGCAIKKHVGRQNCGANHDYWRPMRLGVMN